MKILEIVLALFLPPIAVLLARGAGKSFVISLVLTLLGHIPGVVYALYTITQDGARTA